MGVADKIREIEEEIARTQVNKATEHHLGMLKAKLAKLKRDAVQAAARKGRGGAAFDVKKTGDATVVMIGLPSVGKSTILNRITNAQAKTAAYAFTTLSVIPGIMEHNGAKIQILDMPGILSGAAKGRGRGKEVIAVARSADLVLLVLDVFSPLQVQMLKDELYEIGIRLDEEPPAVSIAEKNRGGININTTTKLTKIDERMIMNILNVYGIHNADLTIHEDLTADRLIDALVKNRVYAKSLAVLNKVDLVDKNYVKQLGFKFVPISAEKNLGMEELKRAIYDRLEFIRVYTKPRMGEADMKEPMIIRRGSTVEIMCNRIHRDLAKNFKYAQVWGKSAKFGGQKVGLGHVFADGDIVTIVAK